VSKKRGSEADSNHWMLDTSSYILSEVRPAVLWGENAPGLFTTSGEGLVKKLREIGAKLGYSFSLMRTSTVLHGIPQRRNRTFYFFWNSPTVPMMSYRRRTCKDWVSYLKEIPKDASHQDMFVTEGKASERFRPYQFVLEREGLSHAEFAIKFGKGTICGYLEKHNLIDECIDWLNIRYPGEAFCFKRKGTKTHEEYLKHIKKKRRQGCGYWDISPRFMGRDSFAAVMKKTMVSAVHPEEDRFLNAREFMHLMGLPHDFQLASGNNLNHIAQNVPTNTACDMAEEVIKFLQGKLEVSKFSFVRQCNITQSTVSAEIGKISPVTRTKLSEMISRGIFKIRKGKSEKKRKFSEKDKIKTQVKRRKGQYRKLSVKDYDMKRMGRKKWREEIKIMERRFEEEFRSKRDDQDFSLTDENGNTIVCQNPAIKGFKSSCATCDSMSGKTVDHHGMWWRQCSTECQCYVCSDILMYF